MSLTETKPFFGAGGTHVAVTKKGPALLWYVIEHSISLDVMKPLGYLGCIEWIDILSSYLKPMALSSGTRLGLKLFCSKDQGNERPLLLMTKRPGEWLGSPLPLKETLSFSSSI